MFSTFSAIWIEEDGRDGASIPPRNMKAMVATRLGGPEVLELREVADPQPDSGQTVIDVVRGGINFADLLSLSGRYAAAPPPPFIPGMEVSGTEADGGRPVIALVGVGGYAEKVIADIRFVFDAAELDLELAGGWPLVTITAYCGLVEMARLRGGETVLVTAAAGGLGSTIVQVAKALAAGRIVGMASTSEKRDFALRQGADEAIGYDDPIPPVDIVLDGVGGTVFGRIFSAVRPLGRIVLFGASSGQAPEIPSFDVLRRHNVGILPFSFGMLRGADAERTAQLGRAAVDLLKSGRVAPPIRRTFALADAAQALEMLSSRQSMGKLLLAP
jgi:NADPH:quinone reductase